MKTSSFILLGAAVIPFFAGCASTPVALSPVGPGPTGHTTMGPGGYLQVFSDTETHNIGDGPAYYPHMGYNIYSISGTRVRYVANHIGDMDESPTLVRIPEGDYRIVAESSGYGRVTVPVVIQAGKTTVVHLDREWRPRVDHNSNAIIRFPDGAAVGWSGAITKASE